MFKTCASVLVFAVLAAATALAATPVFKCTVDGAVTYRGDPCPTGEPRRAPTVAQLNAERQQRQAGKGDGGSSPLVAAVQRTPAPGSAWRSPAMGQRAPSDAVAEAMVLAKPAFKCDGRTRCAQMRSCAEAEYFLRHCPGVKMDGDHDGTPCEEQWCTR